MLFALKNIVDALVRGTSAQVGRHVGGLRTAMTLIILGLVFVALMTIGVPISFAVGVASVVATLLLPGVDNATIVQRMLTSHQHLPAAGRDLLRLRRHADGARRRRHAAGAHGRGAGRLAARAASRRSSCVASMFFGGVTGSAVAEVSSIGSMMIPAMVKDGYAGASPPPSC